MPQPTTTHHDATSAKICPLPPTTTYHQPKYVHHHPPLPTTNHHQPKFVHHHPPPPTSHHHPQPAKIYPPPPTTSPNIYTTTYHFPKNGPPFHKSQNKFIYNFLRHCFNSYFFFEMQYSFPWRRFCVINFWSVRFSNSKFLLHSVHFTIFKIS